jgi:ABC-type phosphate/phosphonate transport system ATPase subunit
VPATAGVGCRYSTRQQAQALQGVELALEAGQLVALVGASGSGKSTILAQAQRLYDPTGGWRGAWVGDWLAGWLVGGQAAQACLSTNRLVG